MRVLLIEDEPTTAKAIELKLTTEGFNVYSTDLGEEGLDLGKLYDYDIILLDLNLPDMHGYDVLKKLRVAKVQTPVLILSGIAEMDSKIRSFGFGADDYVTKPFRPQELINAIEVRLARHASLMQPYHDEAQRSTNLSKQLKDSTELANIKENLLDQLSQDLREPLSNVNLALHMLGKARTDVERERYLSILRQEYAREMRLLKDVANLREMVTAENLQVLQKFNLLRKQD